MKISCMHRASTKKLYILIAVIMISVPVMGWSQSSSLTANKEGIILTRMDHIVVFASSQKKVDELMRIFREDFQLPVFWGPEGLNVLKGKELKPVHGYSGGIFLGNVTLEFETWEGNDIAERPPVDCGYIGVAFEPAPLEEAIRRLDHKGIKHSEVEPWFAPMPDGSKVMLWELVYLTQFKGTLLNLFICDYEPMPIKEGDKMVMRTHADMRKWLKQQLEANNGGPLSVIRMKELTLGISGMQNRLGEYSDMLEEQGAGEATFKFADDQCLRLVQADSDLVISITLEVSSLEKAANYLKTKSMLDEISENRIGISPGSISGLKIYLEEAGT